jgi:hypothetical protein
MTLTATAPGMFIAEALNAFLFKLPLLLRRATCAWFPAFNPPFFRIPGFLKGIGADGGGDADLMIAFFYPDDLSPALQAHGPVRIDPFQHNGELDGLSGSKGLIRFEKNPGAAEVTGDALALLKFYGRRPLVTMRPAFFRFFHNDSSRIWNLHKFDFAEKPSATV